MGILSADENEGIVASTFSGSVKRVSVVSFRLNVETTKNTLIGGMPHRWDEWESMGIRG